VARQAAERPPFHNVDEIYIFRVKEGKLDSALAVVEDNLTRMRQLGLTP
jgi:hypothetical protein